MTASARKHPTANPFGAVHKRIRLREQREQVAERIASEHALSAVAARVLAARKREGDNLESYLNPTLKVGLPDPAELKNLDAACKLIREIVEAGGSIAICCDFDVDGLSGGSQVQHFFEAIGVKSKVFVPNRFSDGYGLNAGMIQTIAEQGFALILTIDYGTSNKTELELARSLGLKTIVVDHHHVVENPPTDVFINPQQEGCGFADGILCAAGLAWYLIIGLRKELEAARDIDPKSYLDLACLGTICDMVPLIGANRIIAKRGLDLLEISERTGIQALKDVIGIRNKVRCSNVSFGIGPRINAAGRMVDGSLVVELLTTSASKSAKKLADKLNRLNLKRQGVEAAVKEQAVAKLKERGSLPSGIVIWDEEFHTGVIGIVAQRMVEIFYRPAAVLGLDNGVYKGSVRGIKGFSVVAALQEVADCLIKFGGHEGAGGFSIEKDRLEEFASRFEQVCAEKLTGIDKEPVVFADTAVTIAEVTPALVNELKRFEPYGVGNPGPILLLKDIKVMDIKVLKGAHLKLALTDGSRYLTGMMWNTTSHPALEIGERVTIACRPDINNYNGRKDIQAIIQAVQQG